MTRAANCSWVLALAAAAGCATGGGRARGSNAGATPRDASVLDTEAPISLDAATDAGQPLDVGTRDARVDSSIFDAGRDAGRDARVDAPEATGCPSTLVFAGSFTGSGHVPGGRNYSLDGDVSFALSVAVSGTTRRAITTGAVSGLIEGTYPFDARIEGEFDCATGAFVEAELVDGTATLQDRSATLTGTFNGTFGLVSQRFTGTWTAAESGDAGAGTTISASGTWNAQAP